MFHAKTVLVGHSLESDLKALKLIHDVVVDTSVLFPHKMGPPKKRALKTLCIENLKRIIQENGKKLIRQQNNGVTQVLQNSCSDCFVYVNSSTKISTSLAEAGHDSAEDAEVCIQLIKYYLRNKIS